MVWDRCSPPAEYRVFPGYHPRPETAPIIPFPGRRIRAGSLEPGRAVARTLRNGRTTMECRSSLKRVVLSLFVCRATASIYYGNGAAVSYESPPERSGSSESEKGSRGHRGPRGYPVDGSDRRDYRRSGESPTLQTWHSNRGGSCAGGCARRPVGNDGWIEHGHRRRW